VSPALPLPIRVAVILAMPEERLLYFFLSYARGDDDVFVKRFFHDLSSEVRVHAGVKYGQEVGFLDTQSTDLGSLWQNRLTKALSDSRCFVALCSPLYFVSEECGAEWAAFEDKLLRYEAQTGVRPGSLMPLRWCVQDQIPAAVSAVQNDHDDLGEDYSTDGVRQLIRLKSNADSYLRFITALAKKIVRLATAHELPDLPDYTLSAFRSIFHRSTTSPVEAASAAQIPAGDLAARKEVIVRSSQFVHFIIASAPRSEMEAQRESLEYYGDRPEDWAPYLPYVPEALAVFASRVAAARKFSSEVVDLDELHSRIERANRNNEIVVLLVDAWATRLNRQRQILETYDVKNEPTTAVLIPMAASDQETTDNYPVLRDSVRKALSNNAVRGDEAMYHEKLVDHEAFNVALSRALRVAQNRIFDRGPIRSWPPGESVGTRPILQGPA
jgi:FxsC-like protein